MSAFVALVGVAVSALLALMGGLALRRLNRRGDSARRPTSSIGGGGAARELPAARSKRTALTPLSPMSFAQEPMGVRAPRQKDTCGSHPRVVEFGHHPARLWIRYAGVAGKTTDCIVRVDRMVGRGDGGNIDWQEIRGYCELRAQMDTFKLRKIEVAEDPETGMAIADLPAWLKARGYSLD